MVLYFLAKCIVAFIALCLILAYSPVFLDFKPNSYSVSLPDAFKDSLSVNDRLSSTERLFEGEVKRPESMAILDGVIYTGVGDGRIIKIDGNKISTIAQIGKKCNGPWEEHICGRVLGMRFDKKNVLHVIDAYFGLYTVDIKTGKVTPLLTSSTLIDGKQLMFGNDFTFDEDGNIYITESSSRWALNKVLFVVLEHDNTGRLIKFNPRTKETKVLLDGLSFPNGITLSHDKKSLLIAETNANRILQYDLNPKSEKKVKVFVDHLPGEPDNIRHSARNGYWIGFVSGRNTSALSIQDRTAQFPMARKILARFLNTVGLTLNYFAQFFSSDAFKTFAFEVESGRVMVHTIPLHGLIVEVDENGKIAQSLHSPDGKIAYISEVLEYQKYLYLGSWHNHFLGRVKLN